LVAMYSCPLYWPTAHSLITLQGLAFVAERRSETFLESQV
jgi:hypothetical protein